EAMSCELPVILSKEAALADELAAAQAALLIDPHEPRTLATSIRTLLADPNLRRVMGAKARMVVESKYSWPAASRQFEALYEEISRERGFAEQTNDNMGTR